MCPSMNWRHLYLPHLISGSLARSSATTWRRMTRAVHSREESIRDELRITLVGKWSIPGYVEENGPYVQESSIKRRAGKAPGVLFRVMLTLPMKKGVMEESYIPWIPRDNIGHVLDHHRDSTSGSPGGKERPGYSELESTIWRQGPYIGGTMRPVMA